MPVQCNGSPATSFRLGEREYQRCPPSCLARVSHAIPSACNRPPGKPIKYCCRGATPNVSRTSNSASFPSGPSVLTQKFPSLLKKLLSMPSLLKVARSKSPSTLFAVASCIAALCCEALQSAYSEAWQEAH